jgi:hypothetical protein
MSEFLSREIQAEFDAARKRTLRRQARLRVQTGDDIYPILRLRVDGFTLDAAEVGHLRGLVDIYDGTKHLQQCLIIASEVEEGELICTMKRSTTVHDHPPLDYERDENAPIAYLPRF